MASSLSVSCTIFASKLNEESLERFLVSQFNEYNQKFLGRVHKGFKEIQDTLESMF